MFAPINTRGNLKDTAMSEVTEHWDGRYRDNNTPWDSGLPADELARVLQQEQVPTGRALELGCGTGTNAVFLAQQGFEVTAVDCSPLALEAARNRAAQAGVTVQFVTGDVCALSADLGEFDFLFDRGCYHCARRIDLAGYLESLRRVTHGQSRYLSLAGSSNEEPAGPDDTIPRVSEAEVRQELGQVFQIERIEPFRFRDESGSLGPLGWSTWMRRDNAE